MCAHGSPPVNSLRNSAAVIEPAGAPAGVREVGDLALQLLAVVVEERHRPRPIAGAVADARARARPTRPACRTARSSSCRARRRTAPVSVATSTRCVAPSWRAYHSPSPRISRPSASVLITSTVLPSALFRMSPGLIARAARHVLGRRHDADDADRRLQQRDRAHRAGDRGAAGHVVLHPLHLVGRLDRDAAGVERDALADQAEHRRQSARPADRGGTPSGAAARCCRARRRAAAPCRALRSAARRGSRRRRRPRPRAPRRARRTRAASARCPARSRARARGCCTRRGCGRARPPRAAASTPPSGARWSTRGGAGGGSVVL